MESDEAKAFSVSPVPVSMYRGKTK
jgi:hypothetical protein